MTTSLVLTCALGTLQDEVIKIGVTATSCFKSHATRTSLFLDILTGDVNDPEFGRLPNVWSLYKAKEEREKWQVLMALTLCCYYVIQTVDKVENYDEFVAELGAVYAFFGQEAMCMLRYLFDFQSNRGNSSRNDPHLCI